MDKEQHKEHVPGPIIDSGQSREKDHGGDRKSDGYIIESNPQVEDLKNSDQKYICLPHRELL